MSAGLRERMERLRSRVSGDDGEVFVERLVLGAQKFLRICFTPTPGDGSFLRLI